MTFDEANSVRDFVKDQCVLSGWTFVEGNKLSRQKTEPLLATSFLKALSRLNPSIAKKPELAEEVLHSLNTIIVGSRNGSRVAANEECASWRNY